MRSLISVQDRLKAIYTDYSTYLQPIFKFALALFLYISVNNQMGYLSTLNHLPILMILALISAVLPMNGTVLIGVFLIVGHSFGLGVEVGAFATLLYILMLLLYFRFVPSDASALLLTPIAFFFHVPAAVPISLGLLRGPESALSAIFGVLSYQYVDIIHSVIAPMKEEGASNLTGILQTIPKQLLNNKVILLLAAFAAASVVASVICKYLTTFTREAAILISGIVYIFIMIVGTLTLRLHNSVAGILIGTVIAAILCWILNGFVYAVDYSKSKFIRFEDDEYYYYVKAIPKLGKAPAAALEEETEAEPIPDGVDLSARLEDSLKDL